MSIRELACTYAILILHDDNNSITVEKIATLVKVAKVDTEPYWPSLFAKLAKKRNIEDLVLNAGGGCALVAIAAPAVVAATGGAIVDAPITEEKKKEETQEESDDDMGFNLFD